MKFRRLLAAILGALMITSCMSFVAGAEEGYGNSGFGSIILDFIKREYAKGNRAGCRFITVDAYRDVTKFYEKNGFEYFTTLDILDSTRLMYFDLKNVKEQLKDS